MAGEKGYKGKVQLGQVKVAEIGKWETSGIIIRTLDGTELGDEFDSKEYGPGSGGTITFSGWYDPDDSTGQAIIRAAAINKTKIQDIRLYFGALETDFFYCKGDVTCLVVNVGGPSADKDASGLCPINFTLEVSDGVLYKAGAILEAITISFTDASPPLISDSGSGLVAAGFLAAMDVVVEGSTFNDGRKFVIDTGGVAAGVLTLVDDTDNELTTEAVGDAVALIGSL